VKLRLSRDLEADLQGAAGFLYITQSEGLGSAVLLAMAAGVPVIASNVGGLPEIIEHGVTGWLTKNAPPAIAEAIQRLLSDRSAAAGIASAARKMVEERFSIDRMVGQTLMVYGKVV
jgi:glycosyltransferase involved in cell wall biosynthesis